MYEPSEAIRAAKSMDVEIDHEAARIIKEEGLSLWEAMEKARRIVQGRRQRQSARNLYENTSWAIQESYAR